MENSIVEGSFVVPHTSIGKNAHIKDSSIEYSIILDGAEITEVERLEESLIREKRKNQEEKGEENNKTSHRRLLRNKPLTSILL